MGHQTCLVVVVGVVGRQQREVGHQTCLVVVVVVEEVGQ